MRRVAAAMLVFVIASLAGCSSGAAMGSKGPTDSGGSINPFADAPLDTTAPIDAAFDTSAASDAAAAEVLDSSAPDTVVATDSVAPDVPATDAPVDVAIDPTILEQDRCQAAKPRLAWGYGIGGAPECQDTTMSAATGYSVVCAFRKGADGILRCLPVVGGDVVGYQPSCTNTEWVQCGPWPSIGIKVSTKMLVSVNEPDGIHVRYGSIAGVTATTRVYVKNALDVCSVGTTKPPVCDPAIGMGLTISLASTDEIALSKFVASTF